MAHTNRPKRLGYWVSVDELQNFMKLFQEDK